MNCNLIIPTSMHYIDTSLCNYIHITTTIVLYLINNSTVLHIILTPLLPY